MCHNKKPLINNLHIITISLKNIESFKNCNWIKHWAGKWSILTCTYLGYQYTKTLKETLGNSLELSMFTFKKSFSVCLLEKDDHHRFGTELAERIINNEAIALGWCQELKQKTDAILRIIKELKRKKISVQDYNKFLNAFLEYGSPHRAVKIAVDFLPQEILTKLLPKLSGARVYAEPVYVETEKFMRFFAKQLSKKINVPTELILCMNKDEFDNFLTNQTIPSKSILENRYDATAILFENGEFKFVTGKEVLKLENAIAEHLANTDIIKGTTAYPGKVQGKVRIIFEPQNEQNFHQGDILVTGMTRPEYIHLISRSAAFITDAGGMLSHAAITAREIKKPCIVGTEIASKVLKNGDLVEVDADDGIIKIIKKAGMEK